MQNVSIHGYFFDDCVPGAKATQNQLPVGMLSVMALVEVLLNLYLVSYAEVRYFYQLCAELLTS